MDLGSPLLSGPWICHPIGDAQRNPRASRRACVSILLSAHASHTTLSHTALLQTRLSNVNPCVPFTRCSSHTSKRNTPKILTSQQSAQSQESRSTITPLGQLQTGVGNVDLSTHRQCQTDLQRSPTMTVSSRFLGSFRMIIHELIPLTPTTTHGSRFHRSASRLTEFIVIFTAHEAASPTVRLSIPQTARSPWKPPRNHNNNHSN